MRAVLQRVTNAKVSVAGATTGQIGHGWLVLLGVSHNDLPADAAYLAEKTLNLRAFTDADGKMNLSVTDVAGSILVVSQFTLYADCRKGRRPGFSAAAPPALAESLYQEYTNQLRAAGIPVATGLFQADMQVELTNDGPVTMLLDSHKTF